MSDNRIIDKDGNVIYPDFAGTFQPTPRSWRRTLGKLAAGTAVLTTAATVFAATSGGPDAPKKLKSDHSTSYLSHDPMETGIKVGNNDNPTEIADIVNGSKLAGQAELDAAKFIQEQGRDHEADGTPELKPGQLVEAPVLSEPQIQAVNNGEQPKG